MSDREFVLQEIQKTREKYPDFAAIDFTPEEIEGIIGDLMYRSSDILPSEIVDNLYEIGMAWFKERE